MPGFLSPKIFSLEEALELLDEAEDLLKRNVAFLAGGSVDQEAKDAFFEALMTAYITCKNEARTTFTPKSRRKTQP